MAIFPLAKMGSATIDSPTEDMAQRRGVSPWRRRGRDFRIRSVVLGISCGRAILSQHIVEAVDHPAHFGNKSVLMMGDKPLIMVEFL